MVPHITAILQRFTGEWAMWRHPEAILAVCQEIGATTWRDRLLTPVTTLQLLLRHMLQGHTACSHLPHLAGWRFSAAAACQARATRPRRGVDLRLERGGRAGQRPGGGFPMARLLGRFHAGTGVLLTRVVAPRLTHDLAQGQQVHPL